MFYFWHKCARPVCAPQMRAKIQQIVWHGKVRLPSRCRPAPRLLTRRAQDGDPGAVYSLDFNPATGQLATCGSDREIKARAPLRGCGCGCGASPRPPHARAAVGGVLGRGRRAGGPPRGHAGGALAHRQRRALLAGRRPARLRGARRRTPRHRAPPRPRAASRARARVSRAPRRRSRQSAPNLLTHPTPRRRTRARSSSGAPPRRPPAPRPPAPRWARPRAAWAAGSRRALASSLTRRR